MARQVATPWLAAGLAVFVGMMLTGCREEEQDRIVFFEPGEYRGPDDESLDAETVQALEERAGSAALM